MIKKYSKNIVPELEDFLAAWNDPNVQYMSAFTSGSTGKPKEILLAKEAMKTSAEISNRFFKLKKGMKILLCMPMQSIAAQMLVVRALLAEAEIVPVRPSANPILDLEDGILIDFVSLTPYQMSHIIKDKTSCAGAREIRTILLGGAPLPQDMERELSSWSNSIFLSYGMTETLSHIALRQIAPVNAKEFTLLPGYELSLAEDNQTARIRVPWSSSWIKTSDVLDLKNDRSFVILGRADNVINSGGVKIFPEEVEKLLSKIVRSRFCITGISHESLGTALVMLSEEESDRSVIEPYLRRINPHFIPKYYVVGKVPLTKSGKIDRIKAMELVSASGSLP